MSLLDEAKELVAAAAEVVKTLRRYSEDPCNPGVWTSGMRDVHLQHRRGIDGLHRVVKKVEAERAFVQNMVDCPAQLTAARVHSSNLGLFQGILQVLLADIGGVVACQRTFHTRDRSLSVEVDVVARNGALWVKLKSMGSRGLHSASHGKGRFGERSVLEVAGDMAAVAAENRVHFGTPTCCMVFTSDVEEDVLRAIQRETGILTATVADMRVLRGLPLSDEDILRELAEEMGEGMGDEGSDASDGLPTCCAPLPLPSVCGAASDPVDTARINLDVTALFALTSDLTNGQNRWRFPLHSVLDHQARHDRHHPVLPVLQEYLQGKAVLVCATAAREFQSIVGQVAGPEERRRAAELLQQCSVVPDTPSKQALALVESGRIKQRQKVIFGTGDSLKAVTVTANVQFVQAAQDQGVSFTVFAHAARALTERKRLVDAVPLKDDEE